MKINNYIIIGGGISGVLCGHFINDALILEKKGYLGGRITSDVLDDINVDVGAQFISKNLAKRLKILLKTSYLKEVKEPSTVFIIKNKKIVYKNFLKFLVDIPVNRKKKIAFLGDIIKLYLTPPNKLINKSADTFLKKSTRDILRPVVLGLTSENPEKFSSFYIKFLFDNMSEKIQINLSELIEHLSKKLEKNVIFNADVLKINEKKNYFEIIYIKGKKKQKIFSKKIIFSVPSNELVKKFSNVLEKKRIKALNKIRYSCCVTISIKLKKRLPFYIYFIDKGPIWSLVNYSSVGKNIMNLFITGPEANNFLKMNKDKLETYAIDFLISQNYFPEKLSRNDFGEILITRWEECLPIYDTELMNLTEIFKNSIQDRIFFCGDYTDIPSVEGCINSVERVLYQTGHLDY